MIFITIFSILAVSLLFFVNSPEETPWGHDKPDNGHRQVKRPYCPFRKFCIFLNGEAPETIHAECAHLRERVHTLEFGMDFTNHQVKKLLERLQGLEGTNTQLNSDLAEARQAFFNRYSKREVPENPKKRGALVGHPGWFRGNPEQIDKRTP